MGAAFAPSRSLVKQRKGAFLSNKSPVGLALHLSQMATTHDEDVSRKPIDRLGLTAKPDLGQDLC